MKILDKTIFREKNKEINELTKTLKDYTSLLDTLTDEFKNKDLAIKKLEEQLDELNKISAESIAKVMMENTKLKDKVDQKEKARRKAAGKVGGLTAENHKLIDTMAKLQHKLIETKREFSEFREGKYIVKELKPQKVPRKRQVMNVKSGAKTSMIIAKLKPSEKDEAES